MRAPIPAQTTSAGVQNDLGTERFFDEATTPTNMAIMTSRVPLFDDASPRAAVAGNADCGKVSWRDPVIERPDPCRYAQSVAGRRSACRWTVDADGGAFLCSVRRVAEVLACRPTVMAVDVPAGHRGIDLHAVNRLANSVERRASRSREPAADHLCGESCVGGIAVLLVDSVGNADIARDAK